MLAATDFFTTEVWTKAGLITYYVLFFIHVASRRVHIAGNVILFPEEDVNTARAGPVQCRERLGGLLRFYYRGAG